MAADALACALLAAIRRHAEAKAIGRRPVTDPAEVITACVDVIVAMAAAGGPEMAGRVAEHTHAALDAAMAAEFAGPPQVATRLSLLKGAVH